MPHVEKCLPVCPPGPAGFCPFTRALTRCEGSLRARVRCGEAPPQTGHGTYMIDKMLVAIVATFNLL